MAGPNLPPLRTQVGANVTPFVGGISQAAGALTSFTGGLAGATTALGVLAGAKGLAGATRAFADFDEKMTESQAIMGDLSENTMAEMEQAAIDVSRTTLKSADEAAESYFFLASAGLDAEQSIAALPQVAKFAQAGMFSMARATDLATDAQSALGLTVEDATQNLENLTRVTDVLVRGNQLANASVEQFSESLTNKLGARLRILNKDIEEGVAGLAALADQGIKGRRAGRGLSIVYRDLAREAVRSSDAFEELGIEVFDNSGKMRSLSEIVADFETALGGASDRTKTARLQMLGINRRAIGFLNSLIGLSDELAEYEKNLNRAGGATEEVAEKQIKTLNRELELLGSEAQAAKIQIGGMIAPSIEKDARNLRTIVRIVREEIEDLNEEAGEGEDALGGFGTALIEAIPGATSLEMARDALESMADDMERLADEAERVPIEKFGPGAIPGGGRAPAVQGPPAPGVQPPFAPGQEPEKLSAEERERQQQRRTAAEIQRQLQQARNRSLEEEIGLHSRVLQREREKLRMMIREGDEAERIRRQAERVAQIEAKMGAPIEVQAVDRKGRPADLEGIVRTPSGAPSLERGEEVEEPKPADLEGLELPTQPFRNAEDALRQGLIPAIDELAGRAMEGTGALGDLADALLSALGNFLGDKEGGAGLLGDVASAFAGGFSSGGRIPPGRFGVVHPNEMIMTGPANVQPVKKGAGAGTTIEVNVHNEVSAVDSRGIERVVRSREFQRGAVDAIMKATGQSRQVSRAILSGEGA